MTVHFHSSGVFGKGTFCVDGPKRGKRGEILIEVDAADVGMKGDFPIVKNWSVVAEKKEIAPLVFQDRTIVGGDDSWNFDIANRENDPLFIRKGDVFELLGKLKGFKCLFNGKLQFRG